MGRPEKYSTEERKKIKNKKQRDYYRNLSHEQKHEIIMKNALRTTNKKKREGKYRTREMIISNAKNRFNQIIQEKKAIILNKNQNLSGFIIIQCQYGHQWKTTYIRVNKGHWCPICAQYERLLNFKFKSDFSRKKSIFKYCMDHQIPLPSNFKDRITPFDVMEKLKLEYPTRFDYSKMKNDIIKIQNILKKKMIYRRSNVICAFAIYKQNNISKWKAGPLVSSSYHSICNLEKIIGEYD